jgi:heat shock protein HslJ
VRRVTGLVTFSIIAIALSAFGATAHATSSRPPLRGTNWVLTDRVSIGTPLDGVTVDAVFDAKRVTGSSGCNGYSRSYTTNGSRMTIKDDGVSTLIACEGAAGTVEQKYLATLNRVGRWRISGSTLTLSTRGGRRLLVYRASIGAAALRGGWNVTSFYTGNAVSSPTAGTTLTLKFDAKQVSGDGGCNTFSGPFTVSGTDAVTIGPLASTLKACADPALDTQEQQYLAALQASKTYRVSGDTLTLFREGDTIAVSAIRAK